MNNSKTVKTASSERSVLIYLITCAIVAVQPLLDILSSVMINLGKSNYISVSGVVRALIIIAVSVFTLGFYNGKYSRAFKVYNVIAAAYFVVMCLMGAVKGDHVAFFYIVGLMADTYFFAFMFMLIFETAQTVGRRVHPIVIAITAAVYALTIVINYVFKKTDFRYSTSFSVVLALLIPAALAFLVSHIGRENSDDDFAEPTALSWLLPVVGIALLLCGAVMSDSKPVLFVSVIFSAGLFIWTFLSWRDGRLENRPPMFKAFISSALFCVLVLALLPLSPVKSSFDGTFSFRDMLYTYNGPQIAPSEQGDAEPVFGDEDDEGSDSDYVPNLDSGYVPGSDKKDDDKDKDKDKNTSAKADSTVGGGSTEDSGTQPDSEPAGDESTSDESSTDESTDVTETTKWWQTRPNQSDVESILSQISQYIPTLPSSSTTSPSTKPAPDTEEPGTVAPPETDATEQGGGETPAAAIGMGALRSPALPTVGAINIDRTVYYAKQFTSSGLQSKLFGLKYTALFDTTDTVKAAARVHCDPITVLFNYGILGFIVYILPAAFIFLKLIAFILGNLGTIFRSAGCAVYMFTSVVILILSALDGDILAFSAVGGMASVIFANALSICEDTRERMKNDKQS